jgi:hypothetical protein
MCYLLQYVRPNSDVTALGEMIFGSVAMAFQGSVLKVHSMKSPSRLMCTKVFHSPVTGNRSRGIRYTLYLVKLPNVYHALEEIESS